MFFGLFPEKMLNLLLCVYVGGGIMTGIKFYTLTTWDSKFQTFCTTIEAAAKTGYNFRYISQLCREGRFSGAFQCKGLHGKMEWYIPKALILPEESAPQIGNRGHYQHKKRIHRWIDLR